MDKNTLGKRLFELRKSRGWSQPDVGKRIGTSGAIIGRYERGEMTPSIEVVKKFADAFGVTLDYLVADGAQPAALQDARMLQRLKAIESLSTEEREKLLYVVDGLLRDAQARRAYSPAVMS